MSHRPKPPKEGGPTGGRRRRKDTSQEQSLDTSTRSSANNTQPGSPPRPHVDSTELSDDDLAQIAQVFKRLDADGSGELSIRELHGVVIGHVMMDESVFKKIDKNRSGTVSVDEIVMFCYPKVPKRRIQMYFAKRIPADVFYLVKKDFIEMTKESKGKLTESKIRENGEQIGKQPFSVETFRRIAQGRPGVSFNEVIPVLFPCIEKELLDRFMSNRIQVEEFLVLKLYFEILDKDEKGFVTQKDFNRVAQSGDRVLSEDLNATFERLTGGTKFDIQMFNRLDQDRTGKIVFPQFIHAFFPSLTQRMIKVYWEYYTPQRLLEHREQRMVVEQAEEKLRGKQLHDEEKRFKKLSAQFRQDMPTNQLLDNVGVGENGLYDNGTRPSTSSSGDDDKDEGTLFVNEAMTQQREKERKDRAQMEGIEDSDRWLMVVEEHRSRLKLSDGSNISMRKVQQSHFEQQCWKRQSEIKAQEANKQRLKTQG